MPDAIRVTSSRVLAIAGTNFRSTTDSGFTEAQFYSTASYKGGNLAGIGVEENDLSGWNLAGLKLVDASNLTLQNVHSGQNATENAYLQLLQEDEAHGFQR